MKRGPYILKFKDGQYVSANSTSALDIYLTTNQDGAKVFKKFFEANNFKRNINTLPSVEFSVVEASPAA